MYIVHANEHFENGDIIAHGVEFTKWKIPLQALECWLYDAFIKSWDVLLERIFSLICDYELLHESSVTYSKRWSNNSK